MWKNIVKPESSLIKICFMPISHWVTKATNTHSGYVILPFHCNNCYMGTPQFYVILTLSVWFSSHLRVDVLCSLVSSSCFPTKNLYASLVSPIRTTLPLSLPPFCRQLGNIWRAIEIMKLRTMLFSPVACYLFCLSYHSIIKYPLSSNTLNTLSSCSTLSDRDRPNFPFHQLYFLSYGFKNLEEMLVVNFGSWYCM
jgi:hypothetical protein